MDPIAVSINDARKAIGIGRTKAYELIAAGTLKTIRVGRRRLVTVESIRALATEVS